MGYNTFGNILFFGVGMYVCSSVQIGMFFDLASWTDAGGAFIFPAYKLQNFCSYTRTILSRF